MAYCIHSVYPWACSQKSGPGISTFSGDLWSPCLACLLSTEFCAGKHWTGRVLRAARGLQERTKDSYTNQGFSLHCFIRIRGTGELPSRYCVSTSWLYLIHHFHLLYISKPVLDSILLNCPVRSNFHQYVQIRIWRRFAATSFRRKTNSIHIIWEQVPIRLRRSCRKYRSRIEGLHHRLQVSCNKHRCIGTSSEDTW